MDTFSNGYGTHFQKESRKRKDSISYVYFFSMINWQVVSLTGTFCAALFVIVLSYARYKGLVGSWWSKENKQD